jgi:molecular chaperone DnaK
MRDAQLEASQLDHVLMVGGSSRIPYIQEMIKRFVGREIINQQVNADQAVAVGATIQAAILD